LLEGVQHGEVDVRKAATEALRAVDYMISGIKKDYVMSSTD